MPKWENVHKQAWCCNLEYRIYARVDLTRRDVPEENVEREHRISTGAIVIQENQILLVRYSNTDGKNYLVGPGGGVLSNEGIYQAVIREVREETGA